jgi:DNA polymerase-1
MKNDALFTGDKLVCILDGSNFAYRASVLELKVGELQTGVIYGFCRMLLSMDKRFSFDEYYVCWDRGISPRRRKVFQNYKKKELTDEERARRQTIKQQMSVCEEIVQTLGLCSISIEGSEADDVIAVLAQTDVVSGRKIIVSSDRDLLQLVSKNVDVWNPITDAYITLDNFEAVVGVKLEDYVLFRAMVGDASDHIPGVKGIGEVRAKKVLADGLENVLNRNDNLSKMVRENLNRIADNCELISLSRVLDDADFVYSVEKAVEEYKGKVHSVDFSKLGSVLESYQIKSLDVCDFERFVKKS